jgi:hypothetical protein
LATAAVDAGAAAVMRPPEKGFDSPYYVDPPRLHATGL